jgi:hypothetical protein
MRHTFPRNFCYPKDAIERKDSESTAVVYTYERENGSPVGAAAFSGKRNKPDWHYTFRTAEQMEKRIQEHAEAVRASEAYKKERTAKRNAFTHTLAEGDVLRSSWGYDQTNVDFYEVTRVISPKSVEIREIGQEARDTGWLCGQTKPTPGAYIGKPMVKRVSEGNSVKVRSFAWAYPCDPKQETYWSGYA